ncbi:hypothetical protein Mycch_0189 [Mycolicibacterium chubuense NBB4]|uniref:Isoniazid-induced protein IniA n=1 Tax=Mycolicibacterium chubuense (strain NBB4) TaxID=710421 RepID=I4BCK8_MYCCN|nr:hypothetical protein [Mycolicibacterium chubuense]AFM15015.1 hypothetical protein Mycch_0189 [Mycolicibacterium chubuense NBB4]
MSEGPPGLRRLDAVLVAGPARSGTSGVVALLRARMPGHRFVEAHEIAPGDAPSVVVFVVSAVAPMTESDCATVGLLAAHTDAVVAVVAKVDDHRRWRDVLAADRARLGAGDARFAGIPWAGVAAAPRIGEPRIDDLVELLDRVLRDPALAARNNLRAWDTRLRRAIAQLDADAAAPRARADALRAERERLLRTQRVARAQRAIDLRSRIQRMRLESTYAARTRCAAERAALHRELAATGRRGLGPFVARVRAWSGDALTDTDDRIAVALRALTAGHGAAGEPLQDCPPIEVADPPLRSRRLETQLMTVLGAGFGVGVALLTTRLLSGLVPGLLLAGPVLGGLVGLAATVWLVGVRALLHDRAVLDRWVGEVGAAVRGALDERVATRMLAAEAALTSAAAAEGHADRTCLEQIDAELGRLMHEGARAELELRQRIPGLRRALETVRADMETATATDFVVTDR